MQRTPDRRQAVASGVPHSCLVPAESRLPECLPGENGTALVQLALEGPFPQMSKSWVYRRVAVSTTQNSGLGNHPCCGAGSGTWHSLVLCLGCHTATVVQAGAEGSHLRLRWERICLQGHVAVCSAPLLVGSQTRNISSSPALSGNRPAPGLMDPGISHVAACLPRDSRERRYTRGMQTFDIAVLLVKSE